MTGGEALRRVGNALKDFSDPPRPPLPDQVVGLDAKCVLEVAATIDLLNKFFGPELGLSGVGLTYRLRYKTNTAIDVLPLLERVAGGEKLTTADVRRIRASLKEFGSCLEATDAGLGCLSLLPPFWPLVVPARIALNRAVDQGFIERAPALVEDQVRPVIRRAWPYVQQFGLYQNPRVEFQREAWEIYRSVLVGANRLRTERDNPGELRLAGKAIGQTLTEFFDPKSDLAARLPFLEGILGLTRGTRRIDPADVETLGVISPEIVKTLERVLPEGVSRHYGDWLGNQLDLRRDLAMLWPPTSFKIHDVEVICSRLLSATLAVMPTDGPVFKNTFIDWSAKMGVKLEDTPYVQQSRS